MVAMLFLVAVLLLVPVCAIGEGADATPEEFVAPAQGASSGFEAVFAPEVFKVDTRDIGRTSEVVVAAGPRHAAGELVEIGCAVAAHQPGGPDVLIKECIFTVVAGFLPVFLLVTTVPVIMLVRSRLAVSDAGDADESGVRPEWQGPGDLGPAQEQAVIAEEPGVHGFGVDKVPGVQVGGILDAEAGKELSTLDFKSTGQVGDFSEGLFQFAVPITFPVLEEDAVGESFEVFGPQGNPRFDGLGGEIFAAGVVAAGGKVGGVAGGPSADAVHVEVREEHTTDIPVVEFFP